TLLAQRRIVASVKGGDSTPGPMALSTIGIEIRAGPVFERASLVVGPRQAAQMRQVCLIAWRIEQADVVPGAQLIVADAGRKWEHAIHLPCFHTEHAPGQIGMT